MMILLWLIVFEGGQAAAPPVNPFDRPCLTMTESVGSMSMAASDISLSMSETGAISMTMEEVGCGD